MPQSRCRQVPALLFTGSPLGESFGLKSEHLWAPARNATCSRCPSAMGSAVSVLSLYYVTRECTADRFGRKVPSTPPPEGLRCILPP